MKTKALGLIGTLLLEALAAPALAVSPPTGPLGTVVDVRVGVVAAATALANLAGTGLRGARVGFSVAARSPAPIPGPRSACSAPGAWGTASR